jgi:hypothetical protein
MKRHIVASLMALALAAPALAQSGQDPMSTGQQAQKPQVDMSKMGPWTRKPANEGEIRKDIERFLKDEERLMKQRDFQSMIGRIDFPVYMVTDDSRGTPMTKEFNQQEYVATMKPAFDQTPKDLEAKHRWKVTVLSDALATVSDDFTLKHGGETKEGRSAALVVKRGGQWKWKTMAEAGWGDTMTGVGGAGSVDQPEEPMPPPESPLPDSEPMPPPEQQ